LKRIYIPPEIVPLGEKLAQILSADQIKAIKTWNDIRILEDRYQLYYPPDTKKNGVMIKIGYMLQETGVLATRIDDRSFGYEKILSRFNQDAAKLATPYAKWLKDSGRSLSTVITNLHRILDFDEWLQRKGIDLLLVTEHQIRKYLAVLSDKNGYDGSRNSYYMLHRFYRWLKFNDKVLFNPVPVMNFPHKYEKLIVVDDNDLKKLRSFITNHESHPEDAMILALVLFFGFTSYSLLNATVDFCNGFTIHQHHLNISYGRHHHNREDTFTPPEYSQWLNELVERYKKYWQSYYDKMQGSHYTRPLLIHERSEHARPISHRTLMRRVYRATVAATGKKIPLKVLRQTCGHIYSREKDTSILPTMGWSRNYAYFYALLPRVYFTPNDTSKK
jgi:hypothetical protein